MKFILIALVMMLALVAGTGCDRLFPGKSTGDDTAASASSTKGGAPIQAAMSAISSGKYDEAAQKMKEVTFQNPEDGAAWMVLCQLYSVLSDMKEGPAACEKVISINRNNPDAYAYLGRIYLAGNKLTEAQKQLELAQVLDGKHIPTLSALGALNLQQKNVEKAAKLLNAAFALDAENRAVAVNLATALIQLNRCDEAESVIEAAAAAGAKVDSLVSLKAKSCRAAPDVPATSVEGMVEFKSSDGKVFYMDKRSANGSEYSDCVDEKICKKPSYDEFNRKGEGRDEPAMSVNFFGAEAYCNWKGKRLPTLAEYQIAYKDLDWRGCCVRGVIPVEWASDAGPSDEKAMQVRKTADSLNEISKKKKVGVDSSTVRCALDGSSSAK